jgi:hypothetical protein
VRQIDLSGFGGGWPGTIKPVRHNGGVEAQIDLGADDALAVIADIIGKLPDLKPTGDKEGKGTRAVAAKPGAKAAPSPKAPVITPAADPKDAYESAKKRMALLEKVAATRRNEAVKAGKDGDQAYTQALSGGAYEAAKRVIREYEEAQLVAVPELADELVIHADEETAAGPVEPVEQFVEENELH